MTDTPHLHENPPLTKLNANYRTVEAEARDEAAPLIAQAIDGMRQAFGRPARRAQKNLRVAPQ